jgi:hypothetical protein
MRPGGGHKGEQSRHGYGYGHVYGYAYGAVTSWTALLTSLFTFDHCHAYLCDDSFAFDVIRGCVAGHGGSGHLALALRTRLPQLPRKSLPDLRRRVGRYYTRHVSGRRELRRARRAKGEAQNLRCERKDFNNQVKPPGYIPLPRQGSRMPRPTVDRKGQRLLVPGSAARDSSKRSH